MRLAVPFLALGAALCALSPPAVACSIPVFQWALDNWEPDTHELVVFHSGPLDSDAQKLIDANASQKSNLHIKPVDVAAQLDARVKALWAAQNSPPLPWAVLRAPSGESLSDKPAWAGPFTEASISDLVDSPVRRQLADRILEGNAGVWLLLDSGDASKDDATFERLQAQLKGMPAHLSAIALQLNPQLEEHPGEYAFSLVRMSRHDAAEYALVQLLLNTEPDLPAMKEPMAFPVYGRGRVLYALVGGGINDDNIREACEFLVGGCSCLVKDENPGADLLMAVDWNARHKSMPAKAAIPPPAPSHNVVAAAQAQQAAVKDVPRTAFGKSIFVGLAVALIVVVIVTTLAVRRSRKID